MTIAEHYNVKVYEIMPHMADRLKVCPAITTANDIYEIVFANLCAEGWDRDAVAKAMEAK